MCHCAYVLNEEVRQAKAEMRRTETDFAGPAKVARKLARSV
jgi:hypothetical protein